VVLRCRSVREKMTARIKGGHVHSLFRLLAHWGLPESQPAGTPTGPKKGGRGRYKLTFVQSPPASPLFFAPDIFMSPSIILKATTSLILCFLLQALTPLCARAFTASGGGPSLEKTRKDVGVSPTLACYRLPNVFPGASSYLGAGDAPFPVQVAASPPPCGTSPGRTKV